MRIRRGGLTLALLWLCHSAAFGEGRKIDISVRDQGKQAVPGIVVQLSLGGQVVFSAETDANGHAAFTGLKPAHYSLTAAGPGFEPLRQDDLDLSQSDTAVELTLAPVLSRRDTVEVKGTATPVEEGASSSNQAPAEVVKELPNRPATVSDALPLIPGVVRSPEGGLKISGGGEHRSALIVNSADVTDPATGQFGITVPMDSVETLNVYQTPFLAEYGRFTAGLVSVETRRGGEKWNWELNDPFPDFRIRSHQLRGLKDATPRLDFSGPLIPGKLYFSEGFEYAIRKIEIYELPFPNDQKKEEGVNSFAQLDWVVSSRQLVTATVHVAPQKLEYVNLNYYNPEGTTPDASTRHYTATVSDRLSVGGGLFENTLSFTRFDARVWGQGPQDLVMTPAGNSGNYFAQQDRNASRFGWSSTWSFAPLTALGKHSFKVGSYLAGSSEQGRISEHPIDLLNPQDQLLERITFAGGQPFRMIDTDYAFFGQDQWIVSPRLAVDLGLRTESQAISESFRLAPRAGIAWSVWPSKGTVVRGGFGLFYDRVPLNVYAFDHYPSPVVTMYNGAGQVSAGPFLYQNGLGQATSLFPFVFQETTPGNFSPRSATWSVQVEQPLGRFLQLRASYMENRSAGLIILNPVAPNPLTNIGGDLLSGSGRSRYRQFEITSRLRLGGERQLFFSYVRSRARGDLNDFASYLGSFPGPILRPDQFTNLGADLPNRFLAWGVVPLPWGFRIAPVFEYRSGFPYAVLDAAQNYVGLANQNRFPNYLSLDARFSKDFKVSQKYTVRFSISGYNLTDRYNPEAFHNNIADPAYGLFFGQRGRRSTADFDVVF
jgi:hypothetical protein